MSGPLHFEKLEMRASFLLSNCRPVSRRSPPKPGGCRQHTCRPSSSTVLSVTPWTSLRSDRTKPQTLLLWQIRRRCPQGISVVAVKCAPHTPRQSYFGDHLRTLGFTSIAAYSTCSRSLAPKRGAKLSFLIHFSCPTRPPMICVIACQCENRPCCADERASSILGPALSTSPFMERSKDQSSLSGRRDRNMVDHE
jgi:hypothetical protein